MGNLTELQLFDVNGSDWRFGQDEDGTPWVVATDVAKGFGYRDAANCIRILDEDERGTRLVSTPSGLQELKVVFEDGIWELVFRSTKPEAKALKKRVKAILREIRETGSYSGAQKPATALDALEGMVAALREQERRTSELEARTTSMEAKLEGIEGAYDEYTALGYARLHQFPTDRASLARAGLQASALMRADGLRPRKRQDVTFGEVNVYPAAYLDRVFGGVPVAH